MFMLSHGMQRIYEMLAFLVALYSPAALLTWLIIDKFFATGEGNVHAVRQRPGRVRKSSSSAKQPRR